MLKINTNKVKAKQTWTLTAHACIWGVNVDVRGRELELNADESPEVPGQASEQMPAWACWWARRKEE